MTGGAGGGAECADVLVPLDWSEPDGPTISLFIKRISGTAPRRKQIWMLQGGPGASGAIFDGIAGTLAADPTLDFYLPDHRGTGRSTRLGCPAEEVEGSVAPEAWPACIADLQAAWGEDLAAFTITNAARDLEALIARTRAPGQEVHVYGVSYGTIWAQRYLQVAAEPPTSVTLDGPAQAGIEEASLLRFDAWHDEVGAAFLEACAADAFCGERLGPDPRARALSALESLEEGGCPGAAAAGLTRRLARWIFAEALEDIDLRALVPALIYRIERCAPEDVAAIGHLLDLLDEPAVPSAADRLYSPALHHHIALSELCEGAPPSIEELRAREDKAVFSLGYSAELRASMDLWPRYPRDALSGAYPRTDVPVLLLAGELDPQTPAALAARVAPHYASAHQSLVVIPRAAHATLVQSPTASSPHTPCGTSLWLGFLKDPKAPLDRACLDQVQPLDFHGDAGLARSLLGADDLWEGE